jgi:hypothetical protein
MIAGALFVNIGFILLGSRFNYPDVLDEPAAGIPRDFHADAFTIGALFTGLVAASALLIPIAWFSRHLRRPEPHPAAHGDGRNHSWDRAGHRLAALAAARSAPGRGCGRPRHDGGRQG